MPNPTSLASSFSVEAAFPAQLPLSWEGLQSALRPTGLGAELVAWMWWVTLAVFTLVWLLVIAAALHALWRRRGPGREGSERGATRAVLGATVATVVILVLFFAINLHVGRELAQADEPVAMEVELRSYQWWWEVRYRGEGDAGVLTTANELHLPAGVTTRLWLESEDVIHSFWAPNLTGKLDLIPGRRIALLVRPLAPGVYRAQCAEYCGLQHAKMAMMVVVHPPAGFQRWLAAFRRPAADPPDPRGLQVFMQHCAQCHTVRGTAADGQRGPDLTHLASRLTLGAGILPNTRGHLAGWVADPHGPKPGVFMPAVRLDPRDLRALLDYLEGLR